jgi:hypothetical protein
VLEVVGLTGVQVRTGMAEIAETGRLEAGEGPVEQQVELAAVILATE